jgi:O-antigen/teichoic acid export membrane protein
MCDMNEYESRMTDKLTPPFGRMRRYRDMLATSTDATGIDEVVTPELPVVDRAQLSTHKLPAKIRLQAISESSRLSLPILGGISIDNQPTLSLPAIPGPKKAGNQTSLPETQTTGGINYISFAIGLIKSSGIYAIGSMASPLIALILTPFLTHNILHADYGAYAVINVAIALMSGITQISLGSALFRVYITDYEAQRDRLAVISTTLILLSFTSIPATIAMLITAPWLSEILFRNASFSNSVSLAALVMLAQNLTVPGLSWLRAENRAALYTVFTLISLFFNLSASIILVGVLHLGIVGALSATGGSYAVVVVCTLPLVLQRAGLHLRFDIARKLLFFGVPMVLSFISVWVLQLSDRYLLSYFGSLAQTASYSVAYTLGGALSPVILGPFGLAWPSIMYTIAKRKDAAYIYKFVFRWFSIVLLVAVFALSLLAIVLLNMLFPPAYHSAAPVIPIVAMSTMFYGIYNVFTVGIFVQRKPWFIIIFTSLAALVNVGLNIILIPLYGSMGAAVSTLLAYALLALIAYIVNQRVYPIPFEIGKFLFALLVGTGLYVGSTALGKTQKTLGTWGIYMCALALYTGCLLLLGKFPARILIKKIFQQKQEDSVS